MADVEEVERFLTAPGNDCKYSVAISSGNTFGNLTENRALFNNMMRVEAYCFNSQNFMLIKYDNTPPADAYVIHFDAARGKYFWIDSDDKVSQTNFALPGTSG